MNKHSQDDNLKYLNELLDRELEEALKPSVEETSLEKEKSNMFNLSNGSFELKSSQMQNEIQQLQNKLTNLEQKMNPHDNHPLISSTNEDPHYKQTDSEHDTPLKKIYQHSKQQQITGNKKIQFRDELSVERDILKKIVRNSPTTNRSNSKKSFQNATTTRVNKFEIEKSIEQAENRLQYSKGSLKRSTSKQIHQRTSSTKDLKSFSNQTEQIQDIKFLNNKLQQMKRAQEEEKQILLKEKQKNQLLLQQIELLTKKVKKLQHNTDKQSQLEMDFNKLSENFEKSEYIRTQQKSLIQSLKNELEKQKQNKPESNQSEPLREKQNSSTINKMKKKKL